MMNEVAQNNMQISNQPLYTKQGIKMNIIERFRKYQKGGTAAQQARKRNTDTRQVNMNSVTIEDNLGRALDREAYAQLQDSLIARNYPFPQRMAILGTSMQEGSPGSYGVGGGGYLGLSSDRMPRSYLGNTPSQRGKQINYILNDLEITHPNNWLDGGAGGIRINSGQDGYNMFWNATDINTATQVLNKSYVRPRDRQKSWNNRSTVARTLGTKAVEITKKNSKKKSKK